MATASTLPSWLDFHALKTLTIVGVGAAIFVALIVLFLVRHWLLKLVLVAVLATGALAAWHYHFQMDKVRRIDCAKLELFGYRVPTPNCPKA